MAGDRVYRRQSVGRADEAEIDPFAVAVMDELGVDHRPATTPRRFDDLEDSAFDLVISLTPEAQHRPSSWPAPRRATSSTGRPSTRPLARASREAVLDAYREVRDDLSERILRSAFGWRRDVRGMSMRL